MRLGFFSFILIGIFQIFRAGFFAAHFFLDIWSHFSPFPFNKTMECKKICFAVFVFSF